MILIIGSFELDAADMTSARQLTESVVEPTLQEPGCHRYGFSVDISHPSRLVLVECWENAAALAAHLRQAHTQAFLRDFRQLRIHDRQVREYEVSSSATFDPRRYIA
jgi:quinol monooxygenase YgiN